MKMHGAAVFRVYNPKVINCKNRNLKEKFMQEQVNISIINLIKAVVITAGFLAVVYLLGKEVINIMDRYIKNTALFQCAQISSFRRPSNDKTGEVTTIIHDEYIKCAEDKDYVIS